MRSGGAGWGVPPRMGAAGTATTTGLSKLTNAFMRLACGDSPGPGGFLRKSPRSVPAQNDSPAPCQSTTRVFSSFTASLKMPARARYIADVIAFRLVGRLNWMRKMLPVCSVTISSIVEIPVRLVNYTTSPSSGRIDRRDSVVVLGRVFLWFRNGTASAQTIDLARAKSELPKNLLV